MTTPESEIKYNLTHDIGGGRKLYLHFAGISWTQHSEYAWRGNIDQLRTIMAGGSYKAIAKANARAVRSRPTKR